MAAPAVAVLLATTACGTSAPEVARGDCPTDVVRVAASIAQWGDLAELVGGDCVAVTSAISNAKVDPHDYEPTPAALASFDDARVIVVNGLDYDHWAEQAIDVLGGSPEIVEAANVAGHDEPSNGQSSHSGQSGHSHETNPHLWYSPTVVHAMVGALADAIESAAPAATPYVRARGAGRVASEMQQYDAAVADARSPAAGHRYAATEPVFDDMAAALDMVDATPAGYRRAASAEAEPSPADLAAFEDALSSGTVDVLIVNRQSEGPVVDRIVDSAKRHDVPIVDVTEAAPSGTGFFEWQIGQLRRLASVMHGRNGTVDR